MFHSYKVVIQVQYNFSRFGYEPLMTMGGDETIQSVDNIAELLVPVYGCSCINPTAGTVSYSKGIRSSVSILSIILSLSAHKFHICNILSVKMLDVQLCANIISQILIVISVCAPLVITADDA